MYFHLTFFFSLKQEKCFQYWPSEGSVTFGDYTVELTGDTQCETFTLKDMVLTYRPVREVLFPHFKAANRSFKKNKCTFNISLKMSSLKVQETSFNLSRQITESALRLTRKSSHNTSDTSTSTDGLRSEYRPRDEE